MELIIFLFQGGQVEMLRSVAYIFLVATIVAPLIHGISLPHPKDIKTVKTNTGRPLRILTFNTWLFGGSVNDGLYKLAKHIKILQPDIVALQVSE